MHTPGCGTGRNDAGPEPGDRGVQPDAEKIDIGGNAQFPLAMPADQDADERAGRRIESAAPSRTAHEEPNTSILVRIAEFRHRTHGKPGKNTDQRPLPHLEKGTLLPEGGRVQRAEGGRGGGDGDEQAHDHGHREAQAR